MILRGGKFVNAQPSDGIFIGDSDEYTVVLALASADTAGGVVGLLNPFSYDVLVTDVIIDVTTKSTAAGTVDVGIAADGTTSDDTLIDGLDVGTAAGVFDNRIDKGTNGGMAHWETDEYLTISKASGSAAGLVGFAYIKGIPVQT